MQVKQPLVLLHGWGVNSSIWNPILPLLDPGFEVTVIDLPGYGNDVDCVEEYSLGGVANEFLARAPAQAVWVGWSLGATVAMSAAISHPERVLKLQLVSPTPRFLNGSDWNFGVGLAPFESLADEFDVNYEKALQKFLLLQVHTNDRIRFRESRAMVKELGRTLNQKNPPSRDTLRAGLKILCDTDQRSQLGDLTVSTQVIAGRDDQIVPIEASEFLYQQLENGHSFHRFDASHLPFLEAPNEYIEALTTFVNPIQ